MIVCSQGAGLPFTAWPISGHCPFREASANQEALQGPIPATHHSSYCLITSSIMMIDALFIAGLLIWIIYVDTYVVVVVVVNSSRLVLLCFLM